MTFSYFLRNLPSSDRSEIIHVLSQVEEDIDVLGIQRMSLSPVVSEGGKRYYQPAFLHVGWVSDLPANPAEAPHTCIVCQDVPLPEAYRGPLQANLILVENADPDRVIDHASFVLANDVRHLRNMEALLGVSRENSSLNEVMDMAARLLGNPILLVSNEKAVLCRPQLYRFSDPELEADVQEGLLSESSLQKTRTGFNFDEILKTGFDDSIHSYSKHFAYIRVPLFVRSYLSAELILQCANHPFFYSDFLLLQKLREILCSLLEENFAYDNLQIYHAALIIDMISNENLPEEEIQRRVTALGWQKMRSPKLLVLVSDSPADDRRLRSLRNLLTDCLGKCHTLIYRSSVLALFDSAAASEGWMDRLAASLRENRLKCGLSHQIQDFGLLGKSLTQAQKAVEIGSRMEPERRLYSYADYSLYYMGELLRQQGELQMFLCPEVVELRDYDMRHDGSLIETLYVYLSTGGETQESAERLHIHRNTLFYRISRIKELLGMDLKNGEEKLRVLMSLCFLKVLEDQA